MLKILAQASIGRIPPNLPFVMAKVSDDEGLVERLDRTTLPDGWDSEDSSVARLIGDEWLRSRRSLVLVVPSVFARLEFNAVVNPVYPDYQKIETSAPAAVLWDMRLFR